VTLSRCRQAGPGMRAGSPCAGRERDRTPLMPEIATLSDL
jgi:hypothetical protein